MANHTKNSERSGGVTRGPQKRGLERRRKLIDTAFRMFEATPIEEVSYQEIAAAAQIPLPSCYHFYPGKVDLIRAIADDQTDVFNKEVFAPIDPGAVESWQNVVEIWLQRAVDFHKSSFARRQIFLGRHMPAEVRLDKQLRERTIARNLQSLISEHFAIPQSPEIDKAFFQAVEIGTLMVSLDYMDSSQLDSASARDAGLAMLSYLKNFIPPVVRKTDDTTPKHPDR